MRWRIAAGEHIHAHNTRTNLSDLDTYRYQPDFQAEVAQPADRDVQIYRRANGDVGVRNELWILPTVGCVNAMARQMQNRFLKETNDAEGIDGVHLQPHLRLFSSATTTLIPAPCCKTWCVTRMRGGAGGWSGL
jgi:altronate hydrolase